MRFKPAKSRSMVLRNGKVVDKFRFTIADTAIPSISEKPVKSLGKVFDRSLRDTSIQSTCTELDGWLKSVDSVGLPIYTSPFLLQTPLEKVSVLAQVQSGTLRVVPCASRASRYPAHKLGCLALKWAVTQRFNDHHQDTGGLPSADHHQDTGGLPSADHHQDTGGLPSAEWSQVSHGS
ncbi:hypothetical protein NHX12_018315 [Muraenolepis orangiensis]|uniref:Uncharacterized protein n=1 Tax=Muraenolepis orangiensis TaxID=630683 RepID=A0A9Q0EWL8_9TELE|nr:hypothetical protein NHX12_018315 [Muraenolepis orangiensis]